MKLVIVKTLGCTNLTKNKKSGHKLTIDGSFSANTDLNTALITDVATIRQ
jgi:hypothetical protein